MPTASGPTALAEAGRGQEEIAAASARMEGRATVWAIARIGPTWKPTRNEVSPRTDTAAAAMLEAEKS